MAVVYAHIRLDNNKLFYIGIGKNKRRAFSKFKRNKFWNSIVKKTDYKVEILHDNISVEDAKTIEVELISFYGKAINGGILCNQTDGGDGAFGLVHTEESRIKRSISMKKIMTPERRKRISEYVKGDKNPFYKKTHSANVRKKLSKLKKGVPFYHTKEHEEKRIAALKAVMPNIKRRTGLSHPNSRPVLQFTKDGKFLAEFNCVLDAIKATNSFKVGMACSGQRKTAGGFVWKYKN